MRRDSVSVGTSASNPGPAPWTPRPLANLDPYSGPSHGQDLRSAVLKHRGKRVAHWCPRPQPGQPVPLPEPEAGSPGVGRGSIFLGGLVLGSSFEAQGLSPAGERQAVEELLERNPGQKFHEALREAPLHGLHLLGSLVCGHFPDEGTWSPGSLSQGPALPPTLSVKG